ncbi:hypothetical protein J6590_036065 [Homalodisca vitripennis]|nr:hypothetical protein J6590_036065 [Homalodisca vitripennis]
MTKGRRHSVLYDTVYTILAGYMTKFSLSHGPLAAETAISVSYCTMIKGRRHSVLYDTVYTILAGYMTKFSFSHGPLAAETAISVSYCTMTKGRRHSVLYDTGRRHSVLYDTVYTILAGYMTQFSLSHGPLAAETAISVSYCTMIKGRRHSVLYDTVYTILAGYMTQFSLSHGPLAAETALLPGNALHMISDQMLQRFSFDKLFRIVIPSREAWSERKKPHLPAKLEFFTDVSKTKSCTSAGIVVVRPSKELVVSQSVRQKSHLLWSVLARILVCSIGVS